MVILLIINVKFALIVLIVLAARHVLLMGYVLHVKLPIFY